jgi:ATP-dependent RNA helicase RhlE
VTFKDLNLHKPLLRALDELGFVTPTPIQAEAFSVIMSGKDVVGVAQTGTGKTFGYLLPILRLLKFSNQIPPRVIILVPTRELVLQVVDEAQKLATYLNLRIEGVYGGTNINTQKQKVYDGLDIIVGTPGRLMDLCLNGSLKLKYVKQLVIDEVDEMFDLGFKPQLERIIDLLPDKRKNLMFSATMPEEIEKFINEYFKSPVKIEIAPHGTPLERIEQKGYHVPNFYTKVNMMNHLLKEDETITKALIFTGSKKLADRLYEKMCFSFPGQFGILHSNKSQNFRIRNLERFAEGESRCLITTDIMSRGMDITDVSHVINFDTPNTASNYIHRIGRTGRADKFGISITFINDVEKAYQEEIEELMGMPIPMLEMPEEIEISTVFTDEERPRSGINRKNYLGRHELKDSQGAFHEKKDKNKKVNLGGKYRRTPKKVKTLNRGRLRQQARKNKKDSKL